MELKKLISNKETLKEALGSLSQNDLRDLREEVIKFKNPGKPKSYYKTQVFLNPLESSSTGSIVCFDGDYDYDDGRDRYAFLEISDCHQKIRLHKCNGDTIEDFIAKLILLQGEIEKFLEHLNGGKPQLSLGQKVIINYDSGRKYKEVEKILPFLRYKLSGDDKIYEESDLLLSKQSAELEEFSKIIKKNLIK